MKHIQNAVLAAVLIPMLGIAPAFDSSHQDEEEEDPLSMRERLVRIQANALLPVSSPLGPARVERTLRAYVTGYSSTPEQTDDTPFITASGKEVRDGIVATNLLPLGTRIKIPELYGEKVFVVEDRMHPRMHDRVDIWFPEYAEAKAFGKKAASVHVLES